MKAQFLLILLLFVGLSAFAQPLNTSTPAALLKAAEADEVDGNYYSALENYKKANDDLKEKPISAKIALLQYRIRDFESAEKSFATLLRRDKKKEFTELKYWYAMTLKANGNYVEAKDAFNDYIAETGDMKMAEQARRDIEGCDFARKAQQQELLLINNLGKKVNKPQTEGSPVFTGGELYFSSMNAKQVVVVDGKEEDFTAKVQTVAQTKPGEWGDPAPLGQEINREGYHQGNVSISPDGKTMYFTRALLGEGTVVTESTLFWSEKTSEGWAGADEVVGVNGDYLVKHPCIGELYGEKVLFFSSNMPGGKGGFDLYYATRKSAGTFSLPVNLGDALNTPGDDVSPYYKDGKLWFSSDGHITMGGLDIYQSQWNGSVWSKPANLGKGYNSSVDDQYFTMNGNGFGGFFVSNRPGPNNLKSKTCCDDIWSWEIEQIKARLAAVTFDSKTKKALLGATVQILEVTAKGTNPADSKTNPGANNFDFDLPVEKTFLVIGTRDGYYPDSATVNTVGLKRTTTFEKKLNLRAIPPPPPPKEEEIEIVKDEPIRLNNIYYDYNDDKILLDAEQDLQVLYDLMIQYPDMVIELSSHTDARGNDNYNQGLSQRRAESAKRWLVAKGIVETRIAPVGYGEVKILNQCANGVTCTDEEHRQNRRTEFKITAGPTSIKIKLKQKLDPKTGKPVENKPTKTGGKQSVKPRPFFFDGGLD